MPTYDIAVRLPTPLLAPGDGGPDAFERIWSLIPEGPLRSRWALLPEHGLFLKGLDVPRKWTWKSAFAGARIAAEVRALDRLTERGVPVPEVVAWGAERRRGWPLRSFLLLRAIPDAVDLRCLITEVDPGPTDRRRAAFEATGRAIAAMHATDSYHGTLVCRNVLIHGDGRTPDVTFVDCPMAERGVLPLRRAYLRRRDFRLLARSGIRLTATRDELRLALSLGGESRPDRVIDREHAWLIGQGKIPPGQANV